MAKVGIKTTGSCDAQLMDSFDQSYSSQDKVRFKFNIITNI